MKLLNILYWIIVILCPIQIMISFGLLGAGSTIMGPIYRIGMNPGTPYYSYYVMLLGYNITDGLVDYGVIIFVFIIPSLIANFMLDKMEGGGAANAHIGLIIWISPVILAAFAIIQTILSALGGIVVLPVYLLVGLMHWSRLRKLRSS